MKSELSPTSPRMMAAKGAGAIAMVLASMTAMAASASETRAETRSERSQFERVVRYHAQKYPALESQDLYKLAYQAAMGSEHAVPDRAAAHQWLERELSKLSADPDEPLREPLSPDGALVRVNLRAFLERGGDMEVLLDAFVGTAERFESSMERFENYWRFILAMAETEEIPFAVTTLEELWAEMEGREFPAVHHSPTYRDRYKPAYRVVLRELLDSDAPVMTGR